MAKSELITGFVGGVHYSKIHPEFMEFDEMQFVDESLDWPNYNRRRAVPEIGKCRDAIVGYMDLKKDEREANIEDLKHMIWYSMVVMDEEKYRLNRKKAFDELGIEKIYEKYL